ncbi:uncharacterized protein [Symphalangus syndactylus]|uniref:uncharacterized protein n=1 Tax=Symphalangus syndactylus TaxID=9590 RepID=UPI003007C377
MGGGRLSLPAPGRATEACGAAGAPAERPARSVGVHRAATRLWLACGVHLETKQPRRWKLASPAPSPSAGGDCMLRTPRALPTPLGLPPWKRARPGGRRASGARRAGPVDLEEIEAARWLGRAPPTGLTGTAAPGWAQRTAGAGICQDGRLRLTMLAGPTAGHLGLETPEGHWPHMRAAEIVTMGSRSRWVLACEAVCEGLWRPARGFHS